MTYYESLAACIYSSLGMSTGPESRVARAKHAEFGLAHLDDATMEIDSRS